MANCPSCGADLRDGDWTCRSCGAPAGRAASDPAGGYEEPVRDASYYNAPTTYGTAAPTIQPLRSGSVGGSWKLVWLIIAAVAVVAVAGVWFFFLRSSPSEFAGSWKGTLPASGTQQQGTIKIEKSGGGYLISFVDAAGKSLGPFSGAVKSGNLETRYDYVGADSAQRATSAFIKGFAAAMVDDFRIVFYFKGGGLYVKAEGKPKPGVTASGFHTPVKLVKSD